MNDVIKGGLICFGIGMIVGAIVVSKNKKLATGIDDATDTLTQKFDDAKQMVQDKIQEIKQDNQQINKSKSSSKNKK